MVKSDMSVITKNEFRREFYGCGRNGVLVCSCTRAATLKVLMGALVFSCPRSFRFITATVTKFRFLIASAWIGLSLKKWKVNPWNKKFYWWEVSSTVPKYSFEILAPVSILFYLLFLIYYNLAGNIVHFTQLNLFYSCSYYLTFQIKILHEKRVIGL